MIKKKVIHFLNLSLLAVLLSGCLSDVLQKVGNSKSSTSRSTLVATNGPDTLSENNSRILSANPLILSGNQSLPSNTPMSQVMESFQYFITANESLGGSCSDPSGSFTIADCYHIFQELGGQPLQKNQGTWGYDPNSQNFLQVTTFYHIKKSIEQLQSYMDYAYNLAQPMSGPYYNTAIPTNFWQTGAFWNGSRLNVYSGFALEGNAYYVPSTNTIEMGIDPNFEGMSFAQDPSVIYHEFGHAMVNILLNMRNVSANLGPTFRTQMGTTTYDEAGAINEGIADFFSFLMNSRSHMGEWALGFYQANRPMSEDDPIHAPGISSQFNSRLRYPDYVTYDPYLPELPLEDTHQSGMITSHFLHTLTKEFQQSCNMDLEDAKKNIVYLLMETLGELGDLSARGSSVTPYGNTENINLTYMNEGGQFPAKTWVEKANPINYRRFYQTLAKHLLKISNQVIFCQALNKDKIEQLLDSYGLLLFRNYNENGSGEIIGNNQQVTSVSSLNINNSNLITKDKIIIDDSPSASTAFIIDDRDSMLAIASSLIASGLATSFSPEIPSNLNYNVNNAKVGPGELVGISLNLKNNSNLPMAGLQVLASDWDHMKRDGNFLKPCPINNFPTTSEGGASPDNNPLEVGDCGYTTRMNGTDRFNNEQKEWLAPVCMVQMQGQGASTWVSQAEFRDDRTSPAVGQCLDPEDPNSCYVRAVKGADQAFYSHLEPNSTWGSTIFPSGSGTPTLSLHNLILFEVHPLTPPGTNFICRLRARFSNCSDCFQTPGLNGVEDFYDYEYAGAQPFQVIDFQFVVQD